jgi:hypothetical protein
VLCCITSVSATSAALATRHAVAEGITPNACDKNGPLADGRVLMTSWYLHPKGGSNI